MRSASAWAMASKPAKIAGARSGVSAPICSMAGARSPTVPRCGTDGDELPAEQDGGVGYSAVGAEPECFRGELFGLIGVSGDLRPQGTRERLTPAQQRLVESIGQQLADLEAAVDLVDVSGLASNQIAAPACAQRSSAGSPSRSARTRASAVRAND